MPSKEGQNMICKKQYFGKRLNKGLCFPKNNMKDQFIYKGHNSKTWYISIHLQNIRIFTIPLNNIAQAEYPCMDGVNSIAGYYMLEKHN